MATIKSVDISEELMVLSQGCTITELIKNRFYFGTFSNKPPQETSVIHLFTVDENDIEPFNLAVVAKFIKMIKMKLSSPDLTSKTVVCWVTGSEKRRRNVVICVGVYAIVFLKLSASEVAEKLKQHSTTTVSECFSAVDKAIHLGFVDFNDFCEDVYDRLNDVRLNWIVPRRILGFYGPLYYTHRNYLAPQKYLKYFRQAEVDTILRVNHIKYDANPFVNTGLDHYDLSMLGSIPTDRVLSSFLHISEDSAAVVVVHCRDIKGQAACLISAYLVKHYPLSAEEALVWVWLCTSYCLLEYQKSWLKKKEQFLKKTGSTFRAQRYGRKKHKIHHENGIYSSASANFCLGNMLVTGSGGSSEQTKIGAEKHTGLQYFPVKILG